MPRIADEYQWYIDHINSLRKTPDNMSGLSLDAIRKMIQGKPEEKEDSFLANWSPLAKKYFVREDNCVLFRVKDDNKSKAAKIAEEIRKECESKISLKRGQFVYHKADWSHGKSYVREPISMMLRLNRYFEIYPEYSGLGINISIDNTDYNHVPQSTIREVTVEDIYIGDVFLYDGRFYMVSEKMKGSLFRLERENGEEQQTVIADFDNLIKLQYKRTILSSSKQPEFSEDDFKPADNERSESLPIAGNIEDNRERWEPDLRERLRERERDNRDRVAFYTGLTTIPSRSRMVRRNNATIGTVTVGGTNE